MFFNLFICKAQSICLDMVDNGHTDIVFDGLTKIDSSFNNKTIFFGEYHEIYALPEIKYNLITFLNQHYGHRDVVMEIGISAAFLYNKFLETGDTNFITSPRMVFVKTKTEMDYWIKLYQYNKSQPDERKIIIHGYDFERSEMIKFLFLHLPNSEPPQELQSTIDLIKQYKNTKFKLPVDFWTIHDKIKKDFDKQQELYKKYFTDNYTTVKQVLENEFMQNNVTKRNKTLFAALKTEAFYIAQRPFICFMGEAHTVKYDNSSLYSLVADDITQKTKPTTISILIKDLQNHGYQNEKKKFDYEYFKNFNDKICENLFSTFNSGCDYSIISARQIPLKNTNDFSDYILLMTDKKTDD